MMLRGDNLFEVFRKTAEELSKELMKVESVVGIIDTAITVWAVAYVEEAAVDLDQAVRILYMKPYLASYAEVVGVGGLPLTVTLLRREGFKRYGLQRRGMLRSISLSAPLMLAIPTLRILSGDLSSVSYGLDFPYNVWYAVLGVLAYGPLETFFVVWLIENTDLILGGKKRL